MEFKISATTYTPAGLRAYIEITGDGDTIMSASELDALVTRAGYLATAPGLQPGEELETVTHVAVRNKENADGTVTKHVAFYSENPAVEKRVVNHYMDSAEDIDAFERATGLKLDKLPAVDGQSHPTRTQGKPLSKFIVPLPRPIQIIKEPREYKDSSTGETRKAMTGLGGYAGQPAPAPQTTPAPEAELTPAKRVWANPDVQAHFVTGANYADWLRDTFEDPAQASVQDIVSAFAKLGKPMHRK